MPAPWNHIKPNAAKTKDRDVIARLHLRRLHRADAGGDSTSDVAGRLKRRILPDFGDRDFGEDGKIAERRACI